MKTAEIGIVSHVFCCNRFQNKVIMTGKADLSEAFKSLEERITHTFVNVTKERKHFL